MIPEQMIIFAAAITFTTITMVAFQVKSNHLRVGRMADRAEDFRRNTEARLEDLRREMGPGPSHAPRARPAPFTGAKSIPRCDYCTAVREPGKTSCHGCGAPMENVLPSLQTMRDWQTETLLKLSGEGLASRREALNEIGFDYAAEMEKLS